MESLRTLISRPLGSSLRGHPAGGWFVTSGSGMACENGVVGENRVWCFRPDRRRCLLHGHYSCPQRHPGSPRTPAGSPPSCPLLWSTAPAGASFASPAKGSATLVHGLPRGCFLFCRVVSLPALTGLGVPSREGRSPHSAARRPLESRAGARRLRLLELTHLWWPCLHFTLLR